MSARPPNPDPPEEYVDVSRKPWTFYFFFILIEFWLAVAGIALLIAGSWIAGGAIIALALIIFVIGAILGA